MNSFLKVISGILISTILCLILTKENKDLATLLSLLAVCMTLVCAFSFLRPVLDFFHGLEKLGNLNPQLLKILMKATGIAILSEITVLICEDSGQKAMGKALQTATTALILWISIPLFEELLTLLNKILGAI